MKKLLKYWDPIGGLCGALAVGAGTCASETWEPHGIGPAVAAGVFLFSWGVVAMARAVLE